MDGIRKTVELLEEVHIEGMRAVDPPARVAVVMAVIFNPLAGQWADDLDPLIDAYSDRLGPLLGERCAEILGQPAEAFGKGALVGLDGEIEHGSAIIHNLRFGDPIRKAAANATSLLPSAEKRAPAGATIDIAMKHVHDVTVRSHHQTFSVAIPDAPRADEIVIAVAMASGGRPHARLAPFAASTEDAKA
jgi:amino acid synthesis protein